MSLSRRIFGCSLVLALVLTSPLTSSAQTPMSVGVVAGMNLAKLSGPNLTKAGQLAGLAGGLMVSSVFNPNVGVEVDALFSQKGTTAFDGRDQEKVRITYLDLPILLRLGVMPKKGAAGFHALVGPTISIKTGSSATYNGVTDTSFKDTYVAGMDLGFTIGGGATVDHLEINARYTLGLRTVDAEKPPDDVKNRVFTILLGYRFK